MSNLPISSKYRSQGNEPVSNEEREDLVKRLNDEFAKGTIASDLYPQLLDRIYDSRTLGELLPVVEALPVKQTYDQPDIVRTNDAAPPAGELTQQRSAKKLAVYTIGGSFIVGVILIILLIALVV